MIKRYNQFVNEKVNEDLIGGTEETTRREIAPPSKRPIKRGTEVIPSYPPSVEPNPLAKYTNDFNEEEEVSGLAKYTNDFNEVEEVSGLDTLAELLGASVEGNVISYDGHEIDQPSETGEFRVDGIDLKTKDTEKVIDYLNNPEAQAQAQAKKEKRVQAQAQRAQNEFETGRIDPELEAKSYKYTMEVMERSKSRKERRLK